MAAFWVGDPAISPTLPGPVHHHHLRCQNQGPRDPILHRGPLLQFSFPFQVFWLWAFSLAQDLSLDFLTKNPPLKTQTAVGAHGNLVELELHLSINPDADQPLKHTFSFTLIVEE